MKSRSYSEQTIKQLFGLTAARCCFPTCRKRVVYPATELSGPTVTGDIAHIRAFSDGGPRADSSLDGKSRNKFENLLLLCAACHRLVDGQPEEYPDEILAAMKERHLDWVNSRLEREMSDIKFDELEVVCKKIISTSLADSSQMIAVPPEEKLTINGLSPRSAKKIQMGLMQAPQVASYLANMATYVDADFPRRLIAGFRAEYDKHWSNGLRGDALFLLIELFAAGGVQDFERHAAGLAVVSHLFQICDLFETVP
ncbi:ABC-three component system protein [Microbispora sp. NPDC088329]|uniref:ABC-three component system protein n=1 Tax=Microbispora sp. NPDC088329 TaxID=3154869 RepID=UPI0034344921